MGIMFFHRETIIKSLNEKHDYDVIENTKNDKSFNRAVQQQQQKSLHKQKNIILL